jgi:hypothetical protein
VSPYGGPLIRLVLKQGVQGFLGSDQPEQVIDIDGFGAVQTTGSFVSPQRHCLVLVDVAPGQTLWAQYAKSSGELAGMTHDLACAKAREDAQVIVANLRTQLNK